MGLCRITKEEFDALFPHEPKLWYTMTTKPKNIRELITDYLPSKLWRLNNIYRIIDKAGDPVPFVMNRAQLVVYSKSLLHPRLIILKSRQQGISTLWLISYMDDTLFYSNLNCGLMAQGKDEAETLLERVSFTWVTLDPWIKQFLRRKLVKDNSQELKFSNNSSIFIRTSFRSATLQRLHISEFGKIANKYPQRAKETKTGTLQALAIGNTGVIESTAEGNNVFKTMWDSAVKQYGVGRLAGKDFLPVFLSWLHDPDCVEFEEQYPDEEELAYFARLEAEMGIVLTKEQRNFWVAQHRELEGDIHQEYPATPEEAFTASKDGTYWARRYLAKVIRGRQRLPRAKLYDSNLPTYVVIDPGRTDTFVVLFFQVWKGTIRIVGEYYNSGEWLGHYVNEVEEFKRRFGFEIPRWFLPHDMKVEDLTQRNLSREDVLNELGVKNTLVLDKMDLIESIEQVRVKMPDIWIAEECVYIEQCFLGYSKEWDEVHSVWKDKPKKGPFNHGADTVRYMVQAVHLEFTETNDQWRKFERQQRGISL